MLGVRLTVVGDGMEAAAICGLLRTEGIACNHRQTDMGAGAWDATGSGGPREILVAASDLERARELIEPGSS
jgi:Putative prokaryotic signal transducing protein